MLIRFKVDLGSRKNDGISNVNHMCHNINTLLKTVVLETHPVPRG